MSLIYFLLWLIFNGRVTLEIAVIGVLVSLMVDVFVRKVLKLNLTASNLFRFVKIFPDVLLYVVVLLIEILRANFSIIRLVLAPQVEVEPCLVKFRTPLKTEAARIALANSITLTPGTITVSLEGSELLVHALNRNMADGLEGSIFERLLARMERILHA
ncbi:MAG: Na+/H+ antiporter subunit E [Synergistaceae bacterium]|nr:Na+/H+ antiporter subunit E [Synergistaceae bacterium]